MAHERGTPVTSRAAHLLVLAAAALLSWTAVAAEPREVQAPSQAVAIEPARLRVAFKDPPSGFRAGYQDVPLEPVELRYGAQLRDFAAMVRGGKSSLRGYDSAHDRVVHELLLNFDRAPVGATS